MSISEKTLRCLEWDKVKDYLSREAFSQCGKERCLNIELLEDVELIQNQLQETDEALALIESRSNLSQEGLVDLRETLKRLSVCADLTASELFDIAATLKMARGNKATLTKLDVAIFPKLNNFALRLEVLEPLVVAIDNTIDEHKEVRVDASSDLLRLTKEAKKIEGQIKTELNKALRSLSKYLQEPIYTQRNERYVLPVNSNFRNNVAGIVHGSSGSGLTVFVEPEAVLELTNELCIKHGEIEREIIKILKQLSLQCSQVANQIELTYWALVELDMIMAKAKLARKYNGVKPAISTEAKLCLYSAKHPLLILQGVASHVVANDIVLNESTKTIVITGPNTGGKTVYLKAAGILSLMIKAGLLIPVKVGSSAVVFNSVCADIGDEQSLEQSLSTFSSHLSSIIEIISQANSNCLILLDEIGAGTDPKEGAALARAILEYLNQTGAYTISSTHFGELKTLAYTVPGFLNASLEFDEETLSPTYKLKVGIPGSSKATAIAYRLGLKKEIVDFANSLLIGDRTDAQQLIDELEDKLKQVNLREHQAQKLWEQAQCLEQEAKNKLDKTLEREQKLSNEFKGKLEEEYKSARQIIRELIAHLQKDPSSKLAEQTQIQLNSLKNQLSELIPQEVSSQLPSLHKGQSVKIISLNQLATVEEVLQQGNQQKVVVYTGSFRVTVPIADIVLAKVDKSKKRSKIVDQIGVNNSRAPSVFVQTTANTLDLRGQRVDEALRNIEKFLDDAQVNFGGSVMVIHGHGTGAIKAAVREYLSESRQDFQFRSGEPQEGGDGVTVIEI